MDLLILLSLLPCREVPAMILIEPLHDELRTPDRKTEMIPRMVRVLPVPGGPVNVMMMMGVMGVIEVLMKVMMMRVMEVLVMAMNEDWLVR